MRALLLTATFLGAGYVIVACSSDDGGGSSSGATPDSGTNTTPTTTATTPPAPTTTSTTPPPVDAGVDAAPAPAAATPTFSPAAGNYTSAQAVTISTTTAGADIFFTLDGTNPTTASTVYATPIAITQNTTIRAIAVAKGFSQSAVGVAAYTITIPPGTTNPPTPSVVGGQYDNTQSVGLSSTTAGATICYTIDGSTPSCTAGVCQGASATYNGASPVAITTSGTTLRAIACKAGSNDGVMPAQTYTFKAAAPVGTPASGSVVAYNSGVAVQSATSGATIRARADGVDPTCTTGTVLPSNPYTVDNTLQQGVSFRAIACRAGFADSNVSTISWDVRAGAPGTNVADGTYNDDQSVSLTPGTNGASDIHCYTTDGTDPACTPAGCTAGTSGAGPIAITKDNTTIRAVGCAAPSGGAGNTGRITSTPVAATNYRLKVGTISAEGDLANNFIPTVAATVDLDLAVPSTTGEKICYRLDGVSPTCAPTGNPVAVQCGAGSSTYGGTVMGVSVPFTVKAVACKLDYQNSDERSVTFADPTSVVGINVTPGGGQYNNDQTLTMTATPADATICYTQSTANPPDPVCNPTTGLCTTGTTYNSGAKPMVTADATRVKVTACKVGIANAAPVQTFDYVLQAGRPSASLGNGTYPYGTVATFTTVTTGAEIRYTTGFGAGNAPTPTCSSPVLAGGTYVINQNGTTNIRTVACKAGYQISTERSRDYSLDNNVGNVQFSLPGGTYYNTQSVTLTTVSSAAPGATICYTTDGTTPACVGNTNVCTGPVGSNVVGVASGTAVAINASQAITARACATGFDGSAVTGESYLLQVSPLEVNPGSGSYNTAVSPVISQQVAPPERTNGATICYTTNGEDTSFNASCTSTDVDTTCVVANSVNLNFTTSTTLKFAGCKAGFSGTGQTTASYTINAYSRTINLADGGVNDFVDAENALTTTAGYTGYASYDATYVYFGFRGTGVGSLNTTDYVHWYVLAGGSPSTTTTPDNLGGGQFGNVALPSAFSHHVIWRTDNAQSIVRSWNGTQWVNSGVGVTAASGGSGANSYVEMRVTRVALGSPTNFKMVGGLTAGGTNIATTPGNGAFWANWLDANMASFQNPNTASYIKP